MKRKSDNFFQFTGAGRKFGFIPVAASRWMPDVYNPDKSQWLPIFRRYGFTLDHASRRAQKASDKEFYSRFPEEDDA